MAQFIASDTVHRMRDKLGLIEVVASKFYCTYGFAIMGNNNDWISYFGKPLTRSQQHVGLFVTNQKIRIYDLA